MYSVLQVTVMKMETPPSTYFFVAFVDIDAKKEMWQCRAAEAPLAVILGLDGKPADYVSRIVQTGMLPRREFALAAFPFLDPLKYHDASPAPEPVETAN